MSEYEYRVMGCAGGRWKVTEWDNRKEALADYQSASGDWDAVSIERRQPGDDATIQRKPSPDADDWMDVTDEKVHVVGEEVAEA